MTFQTSGYLYFTAHQLHRQAPFHEGTDRRQKPSTRFRVKLDAGPVLRN
jgi:sugar lactone lactonase YvrE